ncbi:hypothetical protein PVK06_009233 [Gossypium arboreum]|uniref:Stomatal closure-related actin-binding protein coiled-coil domain-containing protein n=1 Tax=Gossypium arboreum TaxID=29729 RepID=A0ABR0QLZ6_GOSAR|nr:hypothetical protein PVK06_009233 [Gossypium arboreum]
MEANDLWEVVEEDYKDPSLPANPTMAQFKNQKERKSNEREEHEGDERIKCMKILNLVGEFEVQKMDFGTMKEYFDKLKGLIVVAKLFEKAKLREAASLGKHFCLKKFKDALESLKRCVTRRNKDDVEEVIAMLEALEIELIQRGELIQEKAEVKKLATLRFCSC